MIAFRHADPRYPFLWEAADQPAARWHGPGEGPAHYFCDTPDGAWAEYLRHEEIRDPADLATVRRALWAVEIKDVPQREPELPIETATGPLETHEACRQEARRLRDLGVAGIVAPSAALLPGGARGWRVDGGLEPGPARDGKVFVFYGRRSEIVGWRATAEGRPAAEILSRVRYY